MSEAIATNQTILVVGGGISGMTAALEAAECGKQVILLEKNPSVGGRVSQLYRYFPKLCHPTCGLEINLRRMKANKSVADVPVIFITSKTDVADEERGFSVGASDFIHKPISAPIVAARVKTHLKIKFMLDFLKAENTNLQKNAENSSTELATLREFVWGSSFGKR